MNKTDEFKIEINKSGIVFDNRAAGKKREKTRDLIVDVAVVAFVFGVACAIAAQALMQWIFN